MGVRQNFVDVADVLSGGGGGVVGEQAAAGRAAGPQRPGSPWAAMCRRILPCSRGAAQKGLAAGEAHRLSGQVVEGGGKGGEAPSQAGGVDRVVGRPSRLACGAHLGMRAAGDEDARHGAGGHVAAARPLRQAASRRVEERQGYASWRTAGIRGKPEVLPVLRILRMRAGFFPGARGEGAGGRIGGRQHHGDAEAAEHRIGEGRLRAGFAGRRQGYGEAARGRDDQPPRGGFCRAQQAQDGEAEVTGEGEAAVGSRQWAIGGSRSVGRVRRFRPA